MASESSPSPSALRDGAALRTQRNVLQRLVAWLWPKTKTPELSPRPLRRSARATDDIDPHEFEENDEGGGSFGHWITDPRSGLPAYVYTLDQRTDPRAYYPNSEGLDRRDHWFQLGNDRVTLMTSNDGFCQVYMADRGGLFLNWIEARRITQPQTFFGYILKFVLVLLRFGQGILELLRKPSRMNPRGSGGGATTDAPDKSEASASRYSYGGGFGYVRTQNAAWSTAFRLAPRKANTERIFGAGTTRTRTGYQDVMVTRTVFAPAGNDPHVVAEVEIENLSGKDISLDYFEYWDVNLHQMQIGWVRTSVAGVVDDQARVWINELFDYTITWHNDPGKAQVLAFHQRRDDGPLRPGEVNREIDSAPPGVFLAYVGGDDHRAETYFVDKSAFFGNGGAHKPDGVMGIAKPADIENKLNHSMPFCFVLRHKLKLGKRAVVPLRYVYGAVDGPLDEPHAFDFLDPHRQASPLPETLAYWRKALPVFSTGRDPVLQRETAWHAFNLLSATLWSDYHKTHYTPQGSAYLYLHSADGVPRDQSLFALPLVYIRPALARHNLILMMQLQGADSLALPYSFVGNGQISDAVGLHAFPSDLDIFLMLALYEYLSATGDFEFLKAELPFYPRGSIPIRVEGQTVLDHLWAAFKHLVEDVDLGPSGLLRIGDGDWDDAIVFQTTLDPRNGADRNESIRAGESIPNTQMAYYILPRLMNLIAPFDPTLAQEMEWFYELISKGLFSRVDPKDDPKAPYVIWRTPNMQKRPPLLMRLWNAIRGRQSGPIPGEWYLRAFLRGQPVWETTDEHKPHQKNKQSEKVTIGNGTFSLQAQPWALISGLAAEMGVEKQVLESVTKYLDDPSPTGAMLVPDGQVWPAISQLLTWGYTRSNPELAWRSLYRHTFAAHAETFPNVWPNIWTGPDGTNSVDMANAGGTWSSPLTPMTDFPAMNANQDAMALLALLRVCGIEPSRTGDGLDIRVPSTPERFELDMALLKLSVRPGRLAGEYRPHNSGTRTLHIHLPERAINIQSDRGQVVSLERQVSIPLIFDQGDLSPIVFEVRWSV